MVVGKDVSVANINAFSAHSAVRRHQEDFLVSFFENRLQTFWNMTLGDTAAAFVAFALIGLNSN